MNILIVGNGFDLSHYLPTKYDHFMDVMEAIEESESESMNFDTLFSKCRENWFIAKTKQYYLIENIFLEKDQLEKIKKLLRDNCWYQYFKNHLENIDTWIDFEQKIESVLIALSQCLADFEKIDNFSKIYEYLKSDLNEKLKIKKQNLKILDFFGLWSEEEYVFTARFDGTNIYKKRFNLNPKFCYGNEIQHGLNSSDFLNFIYKELEKFIEIFDLYLDLIVAQLGPAGMFNIESKSWVEPDKIFSFNYTNTYQRIYDSVKVDYLHGSHGEFQNIILGISDIEDEGLKKLKAYGFTKYHQKLFKDTDYLFLNEYNKQIRIVQKEKVDLKEEINNHSGQYVRNLRANLKKLEEKEFLNLNFFIWGHSLDVSDKDYIIDLFSLNDDMDRNVRVTVFFFNKSAKFYLLNNLLAILKKDKVEQWMKKGWLKFKENPEINFGINAENELKEQAS